MIQVNLVHTGDCRDLLPQVSDDSVSLIHTSPPYNIDKQYRGHQDSLSGQEYSELLKSVIQESWRIQKPGGSFFFQTGYLSGASNETGITPIDHLAHEHFLRAGYQLWDRIIWQYYGGMSFKRKFKNTHESIMWYVKAPDQVEPLFNVDSVREVSRSYDARNNLLGRNPGNVWSCDRVAFGAADRQTTHIAVFPEYVSEMIIRSCSRPGELVLDPFSGSGTVAAVARSLGRSFLAFEKSVEYAEESRIRLSKVQCDEAATLGSLLIKYIVLGSGAKRKNSQVVVEELRSVCKQILVDASNQEVNRRIKEVFVGLPFASAEVKAVKPMLWQTMDMVCQDRESILVLASQLLDWAFPQRARWNNLRKWLHTTDLTGTLQSRMKNGKGLGYLAHLLEDEPGSYYAVGDLVALKPGASVPIIDQRLPITTPPAAKLF